jgi:Tol biopolymer transport system component
MWMRDAVRRGRLPDFGDLASYEYFPYRYGHAFWAYLGGRYGDAVVGAALRAAGKSGDPRAALTSVTGRPADSLVMDWHAALRAAAQPVARATGASLDRPDRAEPGTRAADSIVAAGRRIVGGRGSTQLNLAPALSPDGRRMVYLSEASLFSIDLFLADAETGRTIRRLASTARDPHLESVQFIQSAGAWDADGRRVAFAAVARGRPVLRIVHAGTGRAEREIPLPDIGEVFHPTWSPDGAAIAFSGQAGGFTDLFVYDLTRGRLRRLTEDAYADLQPAWSPDGRVIAFVTDRFGTSLETLAYGDYRLALVEVASGSVRALPALQDAKHINPQWSPDGRSLYFLADRGGITNVYRLSRADGGFAQVTNVFGGASGITPLSPALSVAQRSGRLMYGLYADDGYQLRAIDDPATLAGGPLRELPANVATLPPVERSAPSDVAAALADTRSGLPTAVGDTVRPYRPGFSLDFVAQPGVAVATDRYGTYVGGGVTLYWSDMLGDRSLVTMAQVNNVFGQFDVAGLVAYENRRRRWNWGVAAQQIPYLFGGIVQGTGTVNGEPAYFEQIQLVQQTYRQAAGLAAYPFSRAQRVEFQGGVQHISAEYREITRAYSRRTGNLILDQRSDSSLGNPLTLGSAATALVYDNAVLGATSPILGQRYRLELSPTVGTLDFVTLLADYRRYVMPVRRVTLAGRLVHLGRYGGGADDSRIYPYYLGYPGLVRGYDFGSFDFTECPADPALGCPVVDQLFGSRLLVGNVELRFPLFGVVGLGGGYYGFLPVEAALFYDAGVAWTGNQGARFLGDGPRSFVTSAGVSLRMNLFGFAIGQLDYVRPFDRPAKDWMLRASLTPGF